MSDPVITVIIPTYNRCSRLQRVLNALSQQTLDRALFEVVVVDDGSSDGTPEWLRQATTPFSLRARSQENSGPACARNAGIATASGKFVLFLDDDVVPTPELLAEHLAWQEREQDVVVIGPLASLPHYAQPWVAWEQAKVEAQYRAMEAGDWEPTFRQFWTGNASVPRDAVLAAGGFDNEFLRGEDVELGVRLHLRGMRFRFNPRARGLHHAERSLASWINAHASYGRLEVRIFEKLDGGKASSILAENWSHLHPALRALVRSCIMHPRRHARVSQVLERALLASAALKRPIFADRLCSLLANLAYWRASAEAVGESRMLEIFDRGDRRLAS
jgi:GT2 family glycosyltransferase